MLHNLDDSNLFFLPQVCDSDTKLDPLATVELCKVLESNPMYGAVGGDVMILNLKDSYISFMSSLRYWMAFNIERSCQSFFNCVSCISGPLGKKKGFLYGRVGQRSGGSHDLNAVLYLIETNTSSLFVGT